MLPSSEARRGDHLPPAFFCRGANSAHLEMKPASGSRHSVLVPTTNIKVNSSILFKRKVGSHAKKDNAADLDRAMEVGVYLKGLGVHLNRVFHLTISLQCLGWGGMGKGPIVI